MKFISKFLASVAMLLIIAVGQSTAQNSSTIKNLLNVKDKQYDANRDSAYLDPYYGLKKADHW